MCAGFLRHAKPSLVVRFDYTPHFLTVVDVKKKTVDRHPDEDLGWVQLSLVTGISPRIRQEGNNSLLPLMHARGLSLTVTCSAYSYCRPKVDVGPFSAPTVLQIGRALSSALSLVFVTNSKIRQSPLHRG